MSWLRLIHNLWFQNNVFDSSTSMLVASEWLIPTCCQVFTVFVDCNQALVRHNLKRGCGRPRGFFFRFPGDFFSGYGVYIAKHTRPEAATMRKGFAPLPFSNTERSQYSSLDCAVMPDMSSLGFSCGSVEVAIVWCGSTQDQFGILLLTP